MANKLVGQNYQTPALIAKVTGRAKYAVPSPSPASSTTVCIGRPLIAL